MEPFSSSCSTDAGLTQTPFFAKFRQLLIEHLQGEPVCFRVLIAFFHSCEQRVVARKIPNDMIVDAFPGLEPGPALHRSSIFRNGAAFVIWYQPVETPRTAFQHPFAHQCPRVDFGQIGDCLFSRYSWWQGTLRPPAGPCSCALPQTGHRLTALSARPDVNLHSHAADRPNASVWGS